jgi:hypothetical protein
VDEHTQLANDRGGPFRGQHARTGVSCPLLEETEWRRPDVPDGIPKNTGQLITENFARHGNPVADRQTGQPITRPYRPDTARWAPPIPRAGPQRQKSQGALCAFGNNRH